jgi:flagellar biosynthesis chaperone FliJ
MKLFSEKVESTFTDSNINILGVRNFKEIFVDVFEFEINGKKFIAEKVSDHKGMPVVNIPVVFKGGEYTAPFALRRGVIEILFNEDNATFVKPVLEEVHELLEQHSENEKEEIYSFIKNTVEESTNKLSSDIENKTKYVESLVNEKIINLTTNTIPNIFLKNMKGSDDSNLVDIKERLENIGTEIDDVKAEKESIYTDLKALAEKTSHLSENVDKKINNTLSRVGSIKAALETSIESAVDNLNKKIEDVETNIERYYSEKITNVSNEVHELTEQNKENLIELIEAPISSTETLVEETPV